MNVQEYEFKKCSAIRTYTRSAAEIAVADEGDARIEMEMQSKLALAHGGLRSRGN